MAQTNKIITTKEQDDVAVTLFEGEIYVNFYHEVLQLDVAEAKELLLALGSVIEAAEEDSK